MGYTGSSPCLLKDEGIVVTNAFLCQHCLLMSIDDEVATLIQRILPIVLQHTPPLDTATQLASHHDWNVKQYHLNIVMSHLLGSLTSVCMIVDSVMQVHQNGSMIA